jgi:hypothetical protein
MLPDIKKLRAQMFVLFALIFGHIVMHTYLYPLSEMAEVSERSNGR